MSAAPSVPLIVCQPMITCSVQSLRSSAPSPTQKGCQSFTRALSSVSISSTDLCNSLIKQPRDTKSSNKTLSKVAAANRLWRNQRYCTCPAHQYPRAIWHMALLSLNEWLVSLMTSKCHSLPLDKREKSCASPSTIPLWAKWSLYSGIPLHC